GLTRGDEATSSSQALPSRPPPAPATAEAASRGDRAVEPSPSRIRRRRGASGDFFADTATHYGRIQTENRLITRFGVSIWILSIIAVISSCYRNTPTHFGNTP